jgi:hypothetical protein
VLRGVVSAGSPLTLPQPINGRSTSAPCLGAGLFFLGAGAPQKYGRPAGDQRPRECAVQACVDLNADQANGAIPNNWSIWVEKWAPPAEDFVIDLGLIDDPKQSHGLRRAPRSVRPIQRERQTAKLFLVAPA